MRRYERPQKPHIYFRGGYWRVVHMQMKFSSPKTQKVYHLWHAAHGYVNILNGGSYPGGKTRTERLLAPWNDF